MIIVRLKGGMGNQMFQYAFARRLAHKHGAELKFDNGFFGDIEPGNPDHVVRNYDLDIFNVAGTQASKDEVSHLARRTDIDLLERILNKVLGPKASHIREPHFHFSEAAYNAPDDVYLDGYWQSEKYFADAEDLIRSDFTFKEDLEPEAKEVLGEIGNCESVCVNVRRGDFVTNPFHGALGTEYYRHGEELIAQRTASPTFFVFSDDVEWCEENLKFDAPTVFVSHKYAGRKFQDYIRLMAACKHFMVPNSSFAWWAIWFNHNEERTVVAPKNWFSDPTWDTKDLIPQNWIRI